ncbi:syntaxin-22 [Capsella rubella]|uniref:syntaxin-22 n=1 Tax=Capsella rubella TaxID=81985 RepID=UPI000CD4F950|nr:syntaxin-22 [Capsella rubella]
MSFQDLEAGKPLKPPQQRDLINGKRDETQAVASGIFRIKTAVCSFQWLVHNLGTPDDTPELRHKLHKKRLEIVNLVKDTSAKLKEASETDHRSDVALSKKIEDAKLARDFDTVLKEFQKTQHIAAERETTYTPFDPKNNLSSSEVDIGYNRSQKQRVLKKSKRQEVVFLDNEISFNEAVIEEIEQGIQEVQQQIGEIIEVFKDLAVLVNYQGTTMDDMGSHVENAYSATAQGKSHLVTASKAQRSKSSLMCLLMVIFGIALVIVIILLVA